MNEEDNPTLSFALIARWKAILDSGWSLWIGPNLNGSGVGWAAELKPKGANLHEWIRARTLPRLLELCEQHINLN